MGKPGAIALAAGGLSGTHQDRASRKFLLERIFNSRLSRDLPQQRTEHTAPAASPPAAPP